MSLIFPNPPAQNPLFPDNGNESFTLQISTTGGFVGNIATSGTGGPTFVNPSSASQLGRWSRGRFTQPNLATFASWNGVNPYFFRGDGTSGGFTAFFAIATGPTFAADASVFHGFISSVALPNFDMGNAANNALGTFGFGADAADANWQVFRRTSGVGATKVDVGIAKAANQQFYITINCMVTGAVQMTIKQITGYNNPIVILNSNFITNLPASNQLLVPICYQRSATVLTNWDFFFAKIIKNTIPPMQ